jgi:hypothetical protein
LIQQLPFHHKVLSVAKLPLLASEWLSAFGNFARGSVVFDELIELGEVFGGEDEGFGVDAGFESVHGGDGLASDRGGAGGFLGVTAIGFYLTKSRHGLAPGRAV